MNLKLTIELVPETCWYSNVRSNVSRSIWDKIRLKSYSHANNKCEICNDTGKNQGYRHNVECHEIWEYDDINKNQTLINLISLCPNCHIVKHPGLAGLNGKSHIVMNQLMKVNSISRTEANNVLNEAFKKFEERSKFKWNLDITYIDKYLNGSLKSFDSLF
jgi:hypothetical protein